MTFYVDSWLKGSYTFLVFREKYFLRPFFYCGSEILSAPVRVCYESMLQ